MIISYKINISSAVIAGVDPIEQSVVCSRRVNETTGSISLFVTWWGNFSNLPLTYYSDSLDVTRLTVFNGMQNSTTRDQGIERRLRLVFQSRPKLGKDRQEFLDRTRNNAPIVVQSEVRANGSGFINVLEMPPVTSVVYDHYLLRVSCKG